MYDVVIVGGGPAGATLGRLLDKRLKVLILEKREMKASGRAAREKCCGGLIAPDAQKMLARLGLGIPKEVLVGPQLFSVRTMDFDNKVERFYIRNYININRERFDRWMLDLASERVQVLYNAIYKNYENTPEGVFISYFHDGVEFNVKSRILIGADGASSKIRKSIMGEETNRYVSIQEWYQMDKPSPYYFSMFDSKITDFYCWAIPKDNSLIIGAAIKEEDDANEKFEIFKGKLVDRGFQLEHLIKRSGAYIIRPQKLNQICHGSNSVFLTGEAAGFISPSSAEGMSYAMKSGMMLANAINENIEISHTENIRKKYKSKTKIIKWNIILKNLKSPAMYKPFIRGLIMKCGILSTKIQN